MRFGLLAIALAGCASAGNSASISDAPAGGGGGGGPVYMDAPAVRPDAAMPLPDAYVPPDAPAPPPDAYIPPDAACVPTNVELLANPAFDLSPVGTGWTEQNIDNSYPIITSDTGLNPQSAPYRAWMGGITGDDIGAASATDVLYQDVTVPAGTTQLVLTGYYAVATSESGSTVYDTGSVDLLQTNGTPIEAILSLTNATIATSWTQVSHTFTSNVAGQTVRLRFTTTNDTTNATSFYFDTLSLTATVCQ